MKYEGEYTFKDPNGRVAKCHLVVVDNLVIATELPDNPGMSITNCAEHLAGLVCNAYNIRRNRLIWLEHYDGRVHEWETVQFDLDAEGKFGPPDWHRVLPNFFPKRV